MVKLVIALVVLSNTLFANITLANNAPQLVFVVHPTVPDSKLTKAQLKRIFTMRQANWSDGQLMQVLVYQGPTDLHQRMCKEMLNMFPYQLERFWNKLAYSGLGNLPETVDSVDQMLEKVRSTPGSIGYVQTTSDSIQLSQVKVIEI